MVHADRLRRLLVHVNVISAGLVALHLVVGLAVVWLRLRSQLQLERQRGQLACRLAQQLRLTGGRLQEQRADGSVLDVTVTGPDHDR